jgi:hypothetical protein
MNRQTEPHPGALVVTGSRALALAEHQTQIANHALGQIERERFIEFLVTHPEAADAFQWAVSGHYPLSESLIERYAERWYWARLSENSALPWTEALIARYDERWHWDRLSVNEALPGSEALIARYAERWDWYGLSGNKALPWTEALIARYAERWDWGRLSVHEALPWSEALIERFAERWNWWGLSVNKALPWSEALIERYAGRWSWDGLSRNAALPWSEALITQYAKRLRWDMLSRNGALPWSETLIKRYSKRWAWKGECGEGDWGLSRNQGIPWNEALIARYAERWDWGGWGLSMNGALPWSEALIERYAQRWDWVWLSQNEALPWTEALIERYAQRWDWDEQRWVWNGLSQNEALPWTEVLIARYAERWCMDRLSLNTALPWSERLLLHYADRWDWSNLDLSALPTVLSRWTESQIATAMDRLKPPAADRPADIRPVVLNDKKAGALEVEGFDPELLLNGSELAGYYIERGVHRFVDLARRLADDLNEPLEKLRPFLRTWYSGARDMLEDAGFDVTVMDSHETVKAEFKRLFNEHSVFDHLIDSGELGADSAFDAEAYARAKPHFAAAWAATKAAGNDFKEFFAILIRAFGAGIKPYAIAYAKEIEVQALAGDTASVESTHPPVTGSTDPHSPNMPPPEVPEDTATSEPVWVNVSGLNLAARRLLRQESGWEEEPALLSLAGWALQNLKIDGYMKNYQEDMEALWYRLTLLAQKDPAAAVRLLAFREEGAEPLQASELGPDLTTAANVMLDQMLPWVEDRPPKEP